MSRPRNFFNIRLTEAAIIAAMPPFSYLLLWLYYQPQFEYYNVPIGLFRPDAMQALLFGAGITVFFVVAYVLAQLISRAIPQGHPLLLRLRRFVGILLVPELLFGVIAIFARGYLPPLQYFLLIQLVLLPITAYLVIGDFVIPMLRNSKAKSLRAKFARDADQYRTPSNYLFSKIRFVLPVLVLLIAAVAYTAGTRVTRRARAYTIINSEPKQIVLINYGDKMLTAELKESGGDRYVYRANFRILNANDLGKDTFNYVVIEKDQLDKE